MDKTELNLGIYLDNLRKSRNIPRGEFVDGIMSERQYRRFLKGESSIPFINVGLLVDKLGMNFSSFYTLFQNKINSDSEIAYNLYGMIIQKDYKNALEIVKTHSNFSFTSNSSKLLFNICSAIVKKELLLISEKQAHTNIIELINYPDCLKYQKLNFSELIGLLTISEHLHSNCEDDRIIDFFSDKVSNNVKEILSLSEGWVPSILFTIAKLLGLQGKHKEVLIVCTEGITFCHKHEIYNSLVHLYYTKALAYKYLDNESESIVAINNCIDVLKIEHNPNKTKYFYSLISKYFPSFPIKKDQINI